MGSKPYPYDTHEHLKCETCGSVIGMYDNTNYTCDTCGIVYPLSYVIDKVDIHMINDKTGWIFPMVKRKEIKK